MVNVKKSNFTLLQFFLSPYLYLLIWSSLSSLWSIVFGSREMSSLLAVDMMDVVVVIAPVLMVDNMVVATTVDGAEV
jgi:hypothetical protein